MKSSLSFKEGSTFVVIDSIQKYQPLAKGVDNSQPEASANDSTSNSGSLSFVRVGLSEPTESEEDNLGSPETNSCGDDTDETFYGFDENLGEQLGVGGVEGTKPATSFTAPSVQAAGNDKTSNKL
ncbi:hypothetical protein [Wolbachia endosymbiont of Drosophila tsacasi]|uniref:hypothetical protein n=1 Tax=Wolbachia endosymbiont of Drosophila tsacasi TaxID=3002579 RepID=UPI0023A9E8A3|nr:hypothetical protein [Wolbachia endosymbiont of Drosophila tsacasi]MDE5061717.1 hypothetical protein [Wolbachia endosymbiont of Drosophila tsacasi]